MWGYRSRTSLPLNPARSCRASTRCSTSCASSTWTSCSCRAHWSPPCSPSSAPRRSPNLPSGRFMRRTMKNSHPRTGTAMNFDPKTLSALAVKLHGRRIGVINRIGGDRNHDERLPETALRFSLAGVQLKFSAVMEASGGLTIPAGGMGGSWVVKLPSGRFASVPENEYTMMALARTVGIEVPRTELIDIRDIRAMPAAAVAMEGKALAVQRFDRGAAGETIHMEDFAQVFSLYPDDKYRHRSYANIAAVLWAETGETGTYEFLRRLVFSVLIGNADMHLKNWSLLYPDRRTPVLSPAYDLVATLPYITRDELALTFGGSRSLSEITTDQVRRFADTARLPASPLWPIVTETTDRTVASWEKLAEKDLLLEKMRTAIGDQILSVAKTVAQAAAK